VDSREQLGPKGILKLSYAPPIEAIFYDHPPGASDLASQFGRFQ